MAKPTPMPGRRTFGQKTTVEYLGECVVCKHGIFSDQDHGRAPKPLLGKAHINMCGGVA